MKLNDIGKLPTLAEEYKLVTEKLGTLAQLNVGPLINVLRQSWNHSRNRDPYVTQDAGKFQMYRTSIGPNSEIIDAGPIKNIADLRKAYKAHTGAAAFAVYIGDTAVGFGTFDATNLAGPTRSERFAYDLSKFAGKTNSKLGGATSKRVQEPGRYDDSQKSKVFTGKVMSTGDLAQMLLDFQAIAGENNTTVTAKLVMPDAERDKIRSERFSARSIQKGTEDIQTRLKRYKLSKKPTVNSIEEFMKFVEGAAGAVKVVQFDGRSYTTQVRAGWGNDSKDIMQGKPFSMTYASADPGGYQTLDIHYRYDPLTRMINPIYAKWYDKDYNTQVAVLDPIQYAQSELGAKVDVNNKDSVIPALLNSVKSKQYKHVRTIVNTLKQAGKDWSELDVIDRSVAAEMAKDKKA